MIFHSPCAIGMRLCHLLKRPILSRYRHSKVESTSQEEQDTSEFDVMRDLNLNKASPEAAEVWIAKQVKILENGKGRQWLHPERVSYSN